MGGPPAERVGTRRPRHQTRESIDDHDGPLTDGRGPGRPGPALSRITIAIRDPSVVVLVGAAGAGKSTFAQHHFAPDEILSSDAFRGAIRGDPTDQSVTRVAFRILHAELIRRLAGGGSVLVDATNLTRHARATIVRQAMPFGVPSIAIVLVPPGSLVHARNNARTLGRVPAEIVDRQLAAASALGVDRAGITARLLSEGFAGVTVLASSAEIDLVAVERISP